MKKILIVDDSSFMRKVLSDILKKNGYEDILEAVDGNEAIKLYNDKNPDLVLLDIVMPEPDGIAVLAKIVPKGARVVIISAVGQVNIIEEANKLGAKGYIMKPFDEELVVEEVKNAFTNK